MRRLRRHLILLVMTMLLTGCSSDPEESIGSANGNGSTSASSFATPQAVLDAVRDALRETPPNNKAFLDLIYAENVWQEKLVGWLRAVHEPDREFRIALYEQFGAWTTTPDPFPIWPIDAMTLLETGDDRATARCTSPPRTEPFDRPGAEMTMHLVRVGDRWWMSGYSFEYDEVYGQLTESMLTDVPSTEQWREDASRLAERIRSGEFASLEEAEEAWRRLQLGPE